MSTPSYSSFNSSMSASSAVNQGIGDEMTRVEGILSASISSSNYSEEVVEGTSSSDLLGIT